MIFCFTFILINISLVSKLLPRKILKPCWHAAPNQVQTPTCYIKLNNYNTTIGFITQNNSSLKQRIIFYIYFGNSNIYIYMYIVQTISTTHAYGRRNMRVNPTKSTTATASHDQWKSSITISNGIHLPYISRLLILLPYSKVDLTF